MLLGERLSAETEESTMAYTPEANWNPHKIPAGIKLVRGDVSKQGTLVTLHGKPVGRVQQDKISKLWSGVTTRGKTITDQVTRLAVTDFLSGQVHYSPNTNTTAGKPGKASSNTKPSKPASKPTQASKPTAPATAPAPAVTPFGQWAADTSKGAAQAS